MHHVPTNFQIHTRKKTGGLDNLELPYEKPVILPALHEENVEAHAWAEAFFITDILSEHGLFLALLFPPEVAAEERKRALEFHEFFGELNFQIASKGLPKDFDVFIQELKPPMDSFVEFKKEQQKAQQNGALRSLAWPLFFEHIKHEGERWGRRLEEIRKGNIKLKRKEVVHFWSEIIEEHADFDAHMLDPSEEELFKQFKKTHEKFDEYKEEYKTTSPKDPTEAEIGNIMKAAEEVLEEKTKSAREIDAARIKSIIDPRIADHTRRETIKFIDELKRVQ